jgi:hypothetical protein
MHVRKGGLKGYISVCNSSVLSFEYVYVQMQSSLCVCVSGAGLLYENRASLSARLFRAPVFLRPNSGSTPALVRHSDWVQILRDRIHCLSSYVFFPLYSSVCLSNRGPHLLGWGEAKLEGRCVNKHIVICAPYP